MKNEEEIQRRAEHGIGSGDSDAKAYEVVFDAVKKDPGYSLPAGFADRVANIAAAKQTSSVAAAFVWLGVGAVMLLIALFVAMTRITLPKDLGFLSGMASYLGLFIFGIIFIGLLHFVDRKFIQHRSA